MRSAPHPFPYQGSKRRIAARILARMPPRVRTFVEPFAGSGATTIAAAMGGRAERFVLADANEPLMRLWQAILRAPEALAAEYTRLWSRQAGEEDAFFRAVRAEFNANGQPGHLLFLLARCVKAAVRYNARGEFNNSPDRRRRGMRPEAMRANLVAVAKLLRSTTTAIAADYREVLAAARPEDLVYLDPPWQGVTAGRDRRYVRGFDHGEFVRELAALNERGVPFVLSYDGRTGDKRYGDELPAHLRLQRSEIAAGRSSQSTLLGGAAHTTESLYVSEAAQRRVAATAPLTRSRQVDRAR